MNSRVPPPSFYPGEIPAVAAVVAVQGNMAAEPPREGTMRWNSTDQDILMQTFFKCNGDWLLAKDQEEISFLRSRNYRDIHEKWNRLLMHYNSPQLLAQGDFLLPLTTQRHPLEGSDKSTPHKDNSWSEEEVAALTIGYSRHGRDWNKILEDPSLHPTLRNRSLFSLKSKWSRIQQSKENKTPLKQQQSFASSGTTEGELKPAQLQGDEDEEDDDEEEDDQEEGTVTSPQTKSSKRRMSDVSVDSHSAKRNSSRSSGAGASSVDRSWAEEEVRSLERGYDRYGSDWKAILSDAEFAPFLKHRSVFSLKSKWGRLCKSSKRIFQQHIEMQQRDEGNVDFYDSMPSSGTVPISRMGYEPAAQQMWMEEVASSQRLKAAAFNKRGLASYEARKYQQAVADFNEAIQSDLNFAEAYLNRGLVNNLIGDHESALLDCCIAIELTRYNPQAFLARSISYACQSFFKNALEDCELALQSNQFMIEAVCLRAIILFKTIRSNDHQFFETMSLFEMTMKQLEKLLTISSQDIDLYKHIWRYLKQHVSSKYEDSYAPANTMFAKVRAEANESMNRVSSKDIADVTSELSSSSTLKSISNSGILYDAFELLCGLKFQNRMPFMTEPSAQQPIMISQQVSSRPGTPFGELPGRRNSHHFMGTAFEDPDTLNFAHSPSESKFFFCQDFGTDTNLEDHSRRMEYVELPIAPTTAEEEHLFPLLDSRLSASNEPFLVSPKRPSNSFDPYAAEDAELARYNQDFLKPAAALKFMDFGSDHANAALAQSQHLH